MKTEEEAREELQGMLDVAKIPAKPSYRRHEVCGILNISRSTFQALVERFEPRPGGEHGEPMRPDSIDSYMHQRERRVRFHELIAYLRRNNTYQRKNAMDIRQLSLW
jgi:hypothetical protein